MFELSELTNGVIIFERLEAEVSKGLFRLHIPGSISYRSVNPFGTIYYQYLERRDFKLWRSIYDIKTDSTFNIHTKEPSVGFRIVLKKHIIHVMHDRFFKLMQGQYTIGYDPHNTTTFVLRGDTFYEIVDVSISEKMLQRVPIHDKLLTDFVHSIGQDRIVSLTAHFCWANVLVLDALNFFLNYPDHQYSAEMLLKELVSAALLNKLPMEHLSERHVEGLYEVKEFLKANFKSKLTIAEMAKMANMSETYFKQMFPYIFDYTPHNYLLFEKLEHAKSLIISHPTLNNQEIARESGFSSYNHLQKVFTAKMGCSITEWRNSPTPYLGSRLRF